MDVEPSAFVDADGRPVAFSMPDLKDLGLEELVDTYHRAMTMVRDRPSADGGGWVLMDRPGAHLDGLEVLAELERQVETLKAAQAFLAVLDGASWTQVGQRLGVSKQAAQQRYGQNARGATPEEIARIRQAARS